MNSVVFGVTGYAGGAIARELLARGHSVTGAARNSGPVPAGVVAVEGSLHDPAFVDRIVQGADAVVLAVRATSVAQDGAELQDVVERILPSIERSGALLGVVGGSGTLRRPETGELVMDGAEFQAAWRPEADAQAATLEVLRAAPQSLRWFYLSPSALFGAQVPGERSARYELGKDELVIGADGRSFVSGADYAAAFVDELETPRHLGRRFTVGSE